MADNVVFDFRGKCPLFEHRYGRRGGVIFPYVLGGDLNGVGINFSGADLSTVLSTIRFPFKVAFITAEAYAISDDQGLKSAAASTEPVIRVLYGTRGFATIDAGTTLCDITCAGAGTLATAWAPGDSSTETDILTTQEIGVCLHTAGASATSSKIDGGAKVVVWVAQVEGP